MKYTEPVKQVPEPFIGIKEAVSYFGVTPHTVYAWRKKLNLPSHCFTKGKRGGRLLFKMTEIKAWEQTFQKGIPTF